MINFLAQSRKKKEGGKKDGVNQKVYHRKGETEAERQTREKVQEFEVREEDLRSVETGVLIHLEEGVPKGKVRCDVIVVQRVPIAEGNPDREVLESGIHRVSVPKDVILREKEILRLEDTVLDVPCRLATKTVFHNTTRNLSETK